jgi:hypothetical protein
MFLLEEQGLMKLFILFDQTVEIHQYVLVYGNLKLEDIFILNNKLDLTDLIFCQSNDLSWTISLVINIFYLGYMKRNDER